jgi:hypothetical protein
MDNKYNMYLKKNIILLQVASQEICSTVLFYFGLTQTANWFPESFNS